MHSPRASAPQRLQLIACLSVLALAPVIGVTATPAPAAPAAAVAPLMARELLGAPGKEVLMITVSYPPGGASLPHRHDAQVFVYVLEGELRMQVRGQPEVRVRPGQTFYEGPGDIHEVSANASATAPAKILVFMVRDQDKPPSRDVTP
jgi:quercetin dioxygenase-like cupin family protein